ncbi:MAG TPA: 30S ribosomal protein THX [Bacteroidales bacterium]|jgi:ribosomal small subunit protein bTHX|nr:30S ribosomal protein THX [Bacteroidales bacterium]HPZ35827.1 30S ribosomal protein THX [Bacteroidales bacterium]HQD34399.1 30S ribosomal protein THX [Bacteroidales bacterium]
MGKGDQKSKRGKLCRGTFGKTRLSKRNKRRMLKKKANNSENK